MYNRGLVVEMLELSISCVGLVGVSVLDPVIAAEARNYR